MPTERIADQTLFVHCVDPLCAGNTQRAVAGQVVTTEWTFAERGGEGTVLHGVENSSDAFRVVNPEDNVCRVCGGALEVTNQARPIYENLSGHSAAESVKYFGSYKPGQQRTAEVDAVLERLEDIIANG